MAKESIERIRQAEYQAQQTVNDARRQAESIIAQAREQAERLIEESCAGAREAAEETIAAAREDGAAFSERSEEESREECLRIKKNAEKKRSAAIELVLRHITEGK